MTPAGPAAPSWWTVDVTGGAEAGSTSWTYYVGTQTAYPPGTQPYNDTLETGINVLKDGVLTVEDLSKLDIDSATMNIVKTAEGRAKLFAFPDVADATGGFPGFGQWTLDPFTTPGPAVGTYRFNNTQALATAIYFGNADASGNDPATALSQLGVGQYLKLQNTSDQDRGSLWLITGAPSDQGTFWSMNVTRVQAGTSDLDSLSPTSFVDVGTPTAASTSESGLGVWDFTGFGVGTASNGELSPDIGAAGPDTTTSLAVHDERSDGTNLFGLLDNFKVGDWLILENASDPLNNYAYYKVSSNATYSSPVTTIGVTWVGHTGNFSASDVISVKRVPKAAAQPEARTWGWLSMRTYRVAALQRHSRSRPIPT